MNNHMNKLLGLFVVFALAAALVPTTSAQTSAGTFGSIVKPGDADVTYTLTLATPAYALGFVDDDGDLALDSDESVYYAAGAAVAALDIRCANPISGRTAGSFVLGSHSDVGNAITALPNAGGASFYDADGDGVYDNGEQLYWDVDTSASVSVNDLIISGAGACTLAKSSSPNFNNALAAAPAGFGTYLGFDADGDAAFSSQDVVYDDIDASGDVSVQDVQVSGTSGRIVKATDNDATYSFNAGGAIVPPVYVLSFIDDDGDGALDSDESVYYAVGGALAALDIRCANPVSGRTAGSFVLASHADSTLGVVAVPGAGAFYDADGDAVYDAGEQLYWDTDGSGKVTANDVILSGTGACTLVKSSSPNFNNALAAAPAGFQTFAVFDVDGDAVFSSQDTIYDDVDGSVDASVQDVQLTGAQQGRIVKAGDFDVTYRFAALAPGYTTLGFIDDDGDGALDSDEPVYIVVANGGAAPATLDIRVANPPTGRTVGSFVLGSHADAGLGTTLVPGAGPVYHDADGDGVYDNGEQVYWDTDGSGTVSVNDVILSGSGAGSLVKSSSANFNNALLGTTGGPALIAFVFTFDAFDVDGDALFSSQDAVYVDFDVSGDASVQDVRFTGPAPAKGTNSVTGTSTSGTSTSGTSTSGTSTSGTSTSGTSTSATSSSATSTSATEPADDEEETPGFELVALVAALGAALVLVRRKL